MVRQGRTDSPRWMLPGGGVEAGESMTDALQRELAEEVGLTDENIDRMAAVAESIAPASNPSGRHLIHVIFHATTTSDALALAAGDPDIQELRLYSRDDLLTIPIHPPIATFLSEWTPNTPFAYFGTLWAP